MADVSIKYKGNTIAEMSGGGSKTLTTSGMYCEGDIRVDYAPHFKIFSFSSGSAVAAQEVKVVSADPDVAAHYADTSAMVTVRKVTNTSSIGLCWVVAGNIKNGNDYGVYLNFNSGSSNSQLGIDYPISQQSGQVDTAIYIRCDANGNIFVKCLRQQNNFGGASYTVTFSW